MNTLVESNEVPIIDLAGIGRDPPESWLQETGKLINEAFKTKGLVFIINHGIAEERIQEVYKIFDTFLALPDEVKELYKMVPDNGTGFIPQGLEKLDSKAKIEAKHCYNIEHFTGKLPTAEIPNFKEVVGGVSDEFLELVRLILKLIAVSLGLDCDRFLSFFKGMMTGDDNVTCIRMLYYPPLDENVPLDDTIRCGDHFDYGTCSLLTQDTEGGLEVFYKSEWRRVGYLPGAICLLMGALTNRWTSSQYISIRHRVVAPDSIEGRARGRHCFVFFTHPDNSTPSDPSFLQHCLSGAPLADPAESGAPNAHDYVMGLVAAIRPFNHAAGISY